MNNYTVILNSRNRENSLDSPNDSIYNFDWNALQEGEYKVSWKICKAFPYRSGLQFKLYSGDYTDNVSYFNTAKTFTGLQGASTGYSSDLTNLNTSTNNNVVSSGVDFLFSIQWIGYFFTGSNPTGLWTFYVQSDNESTLWLGSTATTGYTIGNCVVRNDSSSYNATQTGTITLTTNTYYPMRIMYGNGGGGYTMATRFTPPAGVLTSVGTGYYFH